MNPPFLAASTAAYADDQPTPTDPASFLDLIPPLPPLPELSASPSLEELETAVAAMQAINRATWRRTHLLAFLARGEIGEA